MDRLTQIIQFADEAHGDQLRRYTRDRYIVHPVRVMETCRRVTHDITILSAAILHDVLEDTIVTKDQVRNFLSGVMTADEADKTVSVVVELTDVYTKANYPQWNRRKRKNKETDRLGQASAAAQTIKYADMMDNAPEITRKDPDFARTYLHEYNYLLKKITKGDPTLYQEATDTIRQCMLELNIKNDFKQ